MRPCVALSGRGEQLYQRRADQDDGVAASKGRCVFCRHRFLPEGSQPDGIPVAGLLVMEVQDAKITLDLVDLV